MTVCTMLDADRVDQLVHFFSREWWTAHRGPDDVRRMLAATSAVVSVIHSEDDQLVGFARAITDDIYLAVVLDVIVAPDFRHRGVAECWSMPCSRIRKSSTSTVSNWSASPTSSRSTNAGASPPRWERRVSCVEAPTMPSYLTHEYRASYRCVEELTICGARAVAGNMGSLVA